MKIKDDINGIGICDMDYSNGIPFKLVCPSLVETYCRYEGGICVLCGSEDYDVPSQA